MIQKIKDWLKRPESYWDTPKDGSINNTSKTKVKIDTDPSNKVLWQHDCSKPIGQVESCEIKDGCAVLKWTKFEYDIPIPPQPKPDYMAIMGTKANTKNRVWGLAETGNYGESTIVVNPRTKLYPRYNKTS